MSNAEVAPLVDLAPDTISLANPFFASINLLDRGDSGHTPCPELMEYAHFLQWNPDKTEEAFSRLRPVFLKTWFAEVLIPRLRFRPLVEEEAITVLAQACSATPEYRGQIRMLLDYMQEVGIIQRENGTVTLVRAADAQPSAQPPPPIPPAVDSQPERKTGTVDTAFSKGNAGGIQLNINIAVDMNEMGKWRPDRIAAFMSGLATVIQAKGEMEKNESGNGG